jgi:hypothetical protein
MHGVGKGGAGGILHWLVYCTDDGYDRILLLVVLLRRFLYRFWDERKAAEWCQ